MRERVVISTAREVIDRLRVRYPSGAYALLEQVGDSTGARHHRWADAVVMSLWPSRGLEVVGILECFSCGLQTQRQRAEALAKVLSAGGK